MLTALVLSLLSQNPAWCYRSARAGVECNRASGRSGPDFAFFEFAPSGGTGMGAVAQYPNWALQSEDLSSASWTKTGAGAVAPTITTNQAVAPDGTLTADRVQIAATTAGQNSIAVQTTAQTVGPTTGSLYIKGNGTSGTIDLYLNAPLVCARCSYTSTDWTRCTVTNTMTGTGNVYFGNGSADCGSGAQGAQDVFVWGAMVNAGSTAAPYIATTTAAKGYTPTGAKGETLTFTRTGTAMATRTATGGLATTGIADGDLVLMPANQPRVEYDSNGVLGLLVESARTNSILRSEALENASWLYLGNVVAAPARPSAGTTTAPDGTASAETVVYPQVVGASAQSSAAQQWTATAASWTCSAYVKGVSGSGRLYLSATVSGVSFPLSGACDFNSSTWTRCTATGTLTAALYYLQIGVDLRDAAQATQPAQSVYVWGADCEAGGYATSYIPTGAGTATRNAETAYFTTSPASDSLAGSSIAATVQLPAAPAALMGYLSAQLSGSSTGVFLYGNTNSLLVELLTPSRQNSYTITQAASGRVAAWTDATNYAACWNGVCDTSAAVGGSPVSGASPAAIFVGGNSAGLQGNGITTKVCYQPNDVTRCR